MCLECLLGLQGLVWGVGPKPHRPPAVGGCYWQLHPAIATTLKHNHTQSKGQTCGVGGTGGLGSRIVVAMKDFAKIQLHQILAQHLCTCIRAATAVVTQQGKAALWVHATVAGKAKQVRWQRPRCGLGVASVLVWGRMPRLVDRPRCNILLSFVVKERHTRHALAWCFFCLNPLSLYASCSLARCTTTVMAGSD